MENYRLAFTAVLVGLTTALAGCDKIPGTDAHKIKIAEEVAARDLIDPSSAQFRDLKVNDDVVCGEINAKNRMGAYVGFKRFFSDTKAKTSSIDPEFDINELLSAQDLCRSARSNSYSSYSLIKSSCDREMEQVVTQLSQTVFDSGWNLHCEGKALPTGHETTAADVVKNDTQSTTEAIEPETELNQPLEGDDEGVDESMVDESGSAVLASNGTATQSELDRIFNSPLPPREQRPEPQPPVSNTSNAMADPPEPRADPSGQ